MRSPARAPLPILGEGRGVRAAFGSTAIRPNSAPGCNKLLHDRMIARPLPGPTVGLAHRDGPLDQPISPGRISTKLANRACQVLLVIGPEQLETGFVEVLLPRTRVGDERRPAHR